MNGCIVLILIFALLCSVFVGSIDIEEYLYPANTVQAFPFPSLLNANIEKLCSDTTPSALFASTIELIGAKKSDAGKTRIHLLTSLTSNILPYASYVLAINSIYAAARGYSMQIIHEDGPVLYQGALDPDARWNKIKFLSDSLHNLPADDSEQYVVWLDADLAIINFQLDFEQLIQQYQEADIIMSRDKASAPFVGNTGTIIVKNTAWSKHFLDLWWRSYDRRKCCDQNALTWLYERHIPVDVQQRMYFLPANAINTDFPVWKNHNDFSRVLHLAGLTSIYRIKVFQEAFDHICRQAKKSTDRSLHHQLGIDVQYLQHTASLLLDMRLLALDALKQEVHQLLLPQNREHTTSKHKIEELRKLRIRVFDAIKQDDNDADIVQTSREQQVASKVSIEAKVFDLRKSLYEAFAETVRNDLSGRKQSFHEIDLRCPDDVDGDVQDCVVRIELVQDMVSTAIEYILAQDCSQSVNNTMQLCGQVFDDMLAVVNQVLQQTTSRDKVQARFLYYKFKHHQLSADMYQHQVSFHIDWLMAASRVWKEMVSKYQYYGSDYVLADPQKEYVDLLLRLGTVLCSSERFHEGAQQLQYAIQAQEETIEGYQRIKIATNDIIRYAHILLAEIHYNFAICSYEAAGADPIRLQDVKEHLIMTTSLLERHQAQEESRAYQPAMQLLEVVQHFSFFDADVDVIGTANLESPPPSSPPTIVKKTVKLKRRNKKSSQ